MDQIRIDRLKVFAHHGVYPEESQQGQNFYVSAILDVDTREAGLKDELSESVDYGSVCIWENIFQAVFRDDNGSAQLCIDFADGIQKITGRDGV